MNVYQNIDYKAGQKITSDTEISKVIKDDCGVHMSNMFVCRNRQYIVPGLLM